MKQTGDTTEMDEDYRDELCAQADALGMESLTEDEQAIVNGERK